MSTSVNMDTGEVSISDTCRVVIHNSSSGRYISFLDVPDLKKSTLCQADNTRSEPLLILHNLHERHCSEAIGNLPYIIRTGILHYIT